MIHMRSTRLLAVAGLLVLILAGISLLFPRLALSQPSGTQMTGYLWSDNVGWIDLNCANQGDCSPSFGISVASDGTLSGYAWSELVGWVSANASDLAGCPSGTCRAVLGTTALTGWLRIIAGGTAESGGWDGFISLAGASPAYGVTYNSGVFAGYAWGDTNVGWVDFSLARSTYNTCSAAYVCNGQTIMQRDISCNEDPLTPPITCTAPAFCSAGSSTCLYPQTGANGADGNLRVLPTFVRSGATTWVYWDIINAERCDVVGSNGDSWSDMHSSGPSGQQSGAIYDRITFTLTCDPLDPLAQSLVQTATVGIPPVFLEL